MKTTFARSSRFLRAWAIAIEAATFSAPARSAASWKTGPSITSSAPPRKPSSSRFENGLPCMYVTEDTIRTDPDTVKRLYLNRHSKRRARHRSLRHRRPRHAQRRVQPREICNRRSREALRRKKFASTGMATTIAGLSIANSLAAVAAGAHQVHAAANALGERVGNTPMELMLVNLRLLGLIQQDLSRLKEYCEKVARATHTTIPLNYPVRRPRRFSHRHRRSRRRAPQSLSKERS